ncbi:electron transporter RnfG [candidate division KSB1 bacterium]|nr:MAG: electron transporter RnfG [candidate division KSB1 bacterium]
MSKMVKIVLVIGVIGGLSGTSLTALKNSLNTRIEAQKDIYIRGPAIKEIMKNVENDPAATKKEMTFDGVKYVFYPGFKGGKCIAVAFESIGPGGFGGDIKLMVGFNFENSTILGVAATEHHETPGIGARALEFSYLSQYYGLPYKESFKLKKDGGKIDVLTGASYSSTAIVSAVENAAQLIRNHQKEIIETLEKSYESNK